jgi:hypothetical protein
MENCIEELSKKYKDCRVKNKIKRRKNGLQYFRNDGCDNPSGKN